VAPISFVDVGGEPLFPAAGLAEEQRGGVGGDHLLGQGEGAPDGGTAAHDVLPPEPPRRLLSEHHVVALEPLAQALQVLERPPTFRDVLDGLDDPRALPGLALHQA